MFIKVYTRNDVINAMNTYNTMHSFRKAAKHTGISKSTIHRWWSCPFSIGIRKKRDKKQKRKRINIKYPKLLDDIQNIFNIEELKYLSLQSIRKKLNYKKQPSISWLAMCLKRCVIGRRRLSKLYKVKGPNKDVLLEKTKAFIELIKDIPNDEIACLDEISFSNVANSFYGYFRKGEQPKAIEVEARERCSCVAAISTGSYICYEVRRNSYNSESFYEFVKNTLLPFLPPTIKYILMDNISFHKSVQIRTLLKNHQLIPIFIPPYSPSFDPIEEFFSVVKRKYRTLYLETKAFEDSIYSSFETLSSMNTLPFYSHMRKYALDVQIYSI